MHTRVTRPVIAIALALAAVPLLAAPQSTAEPGGQPSAPPTGDRLTELQAMDQVRDLADTVQLYKEPGYGKVAVDHDQREVHVYWKGTLPEGVAKQLGTHPNGVTVTLTPTTFSDAELTAAGVKILTAGYGGGVPVNGVSRSPDMSGVIAKIAPAELARRGAANAQPEGHKSLDQDLTAIAGVPVTIQEGLGVATTTRQNDAPPWQAGGAMRRPDLPTSYCTTGFAMLTSSGAGRLLSAGHCDTSGNLEIRDGSNSAATGVITPGGSAVDVRLQGIDSIIIDPSATPGSTGKTFGGAFNQAPGTPKYEHHLGGQGVPAEDDVVCVSGANSGEHCNEVIKDTGFQFTCPKTTNQICQGFIYGNASGITIAGGDSGAPIYVERSDGRVGARGIQSGGVRDSIVPCPPVADNDPVVKCYQEAVAIGIHRIIDFWSANGHPGLRVEFD